jgi:hypothetical protein
MFTFKKIALLGAAGLAALSMSCSEKADDPSGTLTGLTITDSATGIFLAGTITGNEGITVSTVTATANGAAVEVKGIAGLPKSPVDLTGAYLSGVCGTTGTYTIEITATFSDGTTVSDSKSVPVTCGSTPAPTPPGTYTLSAAGDSYLDVDGKLTYKQSGLTTAAIKESIDLVAYWTANAGDNIYSGMYGNVTTLDDESMARIFNTKTALDAAEDDDPGEAAIAIAANKVFYLESSELDVFKVTVTATAASSVTIKVEAAL